MSESEIVEKRVEIIESLDNNQYQNALKLILKLDGLIKLEQNNGMLDFYGKTISKVYSHLENSIIDRIELSNENYENEMLKIQGLTEFTYKLQLAFKDDQIVQKLRNKFNSKLNVYFEYLHAWIRDGCKRRDDDENDGIEIHISILSSIFLKMQKNTIFNKWSGESVKVKMEEMKKDLGERFDLLEKEIKIALSHHLILSFTQVKTLIDNMKSLTNLSLIPNATKRHKTLFDKYEKLKRKQVNKIC
jgi:hypothetical protein